jgi:uncharacterized membrane protein
MRRLSTVAYTTAALVLLGSAARADIIVCNGFLAPINVAFGYQDQGSFTSAGWWSVGPDACQVVDFAFQGTALYYTADSDYKDGPNNVHDHWGNKVQLFVASKNFNFTDADKSRNDANAEMFSLAEIAPQLQGKAVTITFRFTQGNTTINVTAKK